MAQYAQEEKRIENCSLGTLLENSKRGSKSNYLMELDQPDPSQNKP